MAKNFIKILPKWRINLKNSKFVFRNIPNIAAKKTSKKFKKGMKIEENKKLKNSVKIQKSNNISIFFNAKKEK